ncbi:MAG: flagellar hook protein FlgE [Pseudomonadota bacterium]
MSFQQGLSGLAGATKNLDVIGNNIANVATAGFKQSRAEFADVYASSLYGAGGVQVGIGTQVLNVAQQFTQGNISLTNNPLDVAINGDGFFRLNDNGAITYSRNGQFHLDKDGYLVTNTGLNVMGYTNLTLDVNNNVIGASTLGNIQIDLNDLQPQATTSLQLVMNLDASATAVPATTSFAQGSPATYNFTTNFTAYDSQGGSHPLTMYYTKRGASLWEVNAYLDGTTRLDLNPANPAPGKVQSFISFNPDGSLNTATQQVALTGTFDSAAPNGTSVGPVTVVVGASTLDLTFTKSALNTWQVTGSVGGNPVDLDPNSSNNYHTLTFGGGVVTGGAMLYGVTGVDTSPIFLDFSAMLEAAVPVAPVATATAIPATMANITQPLPALNDLVMTIDLTGTTQYAGDSGVTAVSQDGYARGRVVGVTIDSNGIVNGRYTNGLTRPLQQLVLANFRNPNALVPLGNNQWAAISETGSEVLNTPGLGIAGAVQAGATEDSNVDLTAELVNLIVAQRLYQANAQTIRAQDQILQTLVNLR